MNKMKNRIVKIFISMIITFIILIIIAFGVIWYQIRNYEKETSPVIEKNIEQEIKTYIINYLNNKYGNNNFSIIKIEKDFSYSGIISKTHMGYKAIVSSSVLKNNFDIYIHGTIPSPIDNAQNDFIENYYNENINEYLSQEYDLEFDIWIKDENIPNNCGHIPTLNELVDLNAVNKIYVNITQSNNYNYDNDISGRIDHLKKLSNDLISYLDISKDITYTFTRWAWNNSFSYTIQITKDTIKIINVDGGEIYEFNTNDIKINE